MQSATRNDSTAVRVVYKVQQVKDTCYIKDSVFIRIRADTVFVDRIKTLYRERIRVDTLHATDTLKVYADRYMVKEVEVNRLTSLQHFLVWCGIILLVIAVIYIIYIVINNKTSWLQSVATTIRSWLTR